MRELFSTMLGWLGFEVVLSDAWNAASLIAHHHPPVDVVLTDVAMPGMTGIELAEVLRYQDPALPVVAFTGNAGFLTNSASLMRNFAAVLEKPMTVPEVAKALRNVVARLTS